MPHQGHPHVVASRRVLLEISSLAQFEYVPFDVSDIANADDAAGQVQAKNDSLAADVVGIELSPDFGMVSTMLAIGAIARLVDGRAARVILLSHGTMDESAFVKLAGSEPDEALRIEAAIDAGNFRVTTAVSDFVNSLAKE